MRKDEAKFQTAFNQYLRKKKLHGHFELKQTKNKSLAFSAVEPHQYEGLYAAQRSEFIWKYSDQDQRQKPFDCSCIPPLWAYIVIKYPGKVFYIIELDVFLAEKENSTKKSLTKSRAFDICLHAVSM